MVQWSDEYKEGAYISTKRMVAHWEGIEPVK